MARRRNGAAKRAVRAAGAAALVLGATAVGGAAGCLQILGDEGPFVLGTGGGGTGGAGAAGGSGGTGGTGGTEGCEPNTTRSCYSGPDGTEGVGNCKAGTEACSDDGNSWGACEGEIKPQPEDPTAVGDEGCDGYAPGESLCAELFGDTDVQLGRIVVAAPDGSAIISGTFSGAIDLGNDVLVGQEQAFVAKIDTTCKPLWATQLGGVEGVQLGSITVDAVGDVYVSGAARSPFTVDAASVMVGSFVVKLDNASGQGIWGATCQAGKFDSIATAITVDDQGDVVIGGSFYSAIDCGNGTLASTGATDAFVARFDAVGMPSWANSYGYSTLSYQHITAIGLDPMGNVITAGKFEDGISFSGGAFTAAGNYDIFVLKLAPSGEHLWSKQFGGSILVNVNDIAIDKLAAIFVTGDFSGTINLPGEPSLTNDSEPDGFIFKLNASGNALWAWSFGAGSGQQSGASVDVDTAGHAVISGWFEDSVDLNGGGVLQAAGSKDGFVAKLLGEDGSHVWSRSFKDSPFGGATFTVDGTLTATGSASASFDDTVDFGTGPVDPAGTDAFVLRLAP